MWFDLYYLFLTDSSVYNEYVHFTYRKLLLGVIVSHLTSWREVIFLEMLLQICQRLFIQILYVLLLFDKELNFLNLFICIIIVQVTNNEDKDEREYGSAPRTDYQRFIRLKKQGALTFFIFFVIYSSV